MPKNGINQWGWPDLEELLQCPVCLDIPATGPGITVEQCIHGHHICFNCKPQLENCPLCKCAFHGTRNFVVEELIRHFEILKNTMLLSNVTVEGKPKKKKVLLNAAAPAFEPRQLPRRRVVNTPPLNKGVYPCRVGDCDVKLPVGRLLNHVRSFHAEQLTESIIDFTDSYNQIWEISFKNNKPINKTSFVVFVSGIGLIFLNIEILKTGHLIAIIQACMKYAQAQNFLASLEFYSTNASHSYNTLLVSVRDNIEHMMQTKNCLALTKNQIKNLCVNKKFSCKLRLSRFNLFDVDVLTIPNTEVINVVAGVRASLQKEKKKSKQKSEPPKNNLTKNGISSEQPPSSTSVDQLFDAKFINEIMETIRNKYLLEEIQNNVIQGNTSAASSSVAPPPAVASAKRKKKNKKNR